MEYYLRAAKDDNTEALLNIGNFYKDGQGVKQNYSKAMEYYLRAAKDNNDQALLEIGNFYLHGYGVRKDSTKALDYYLKAAENENSEAYMNILIVYRWAKGSNEYQALQQAALKGNRIAQTIIGTDASDSSD